MIYILSTHSCISLDHTSLINSRLLLGISVSGNLIIIKNLISNTEPLVFSETFYICSPSLLNNIILLIDQAEIIRVLLYYSFFSLKPSPIDRIVHYLSSKYIQNLAIHLYLHF